MNRSSLFLVTALAALVALSPRISLASPDGNSPMILEVVSQPGIGKVLKARHELARGELQRARPLRKPKLVFMSSSGGLSLPSATHTIAVDFAKQQITAVGKLKIKNGTLSNVSQIYVLLQRFPGATLTVTGPSGALTFDDLGYDELAITLSQPLAPGATIDITTSQTGKPNCQAGALGVVPCYLGSNLMEMVGAYWTPMLIDESSTALVDAEQSSLQVTVPAGMKVGCAGLDGGTTANANGTITYTFKPLRGLTFGAGAFEIGSTPFDGKQLRSFVLAPSSSTAGGWRQAVADILAFHGQRYGPYDLPKLDVVEAHPNAGAAFGPLSAVFIPPIVLAQPPLEWGSRTTIAHELGHQWFGGFIELGENFSPWLNEGFATFAEMEYTIAEGSKAYKLDYGPTYRQHNKMTYFYAVVGGKDVALTGSSIWQAPDEIYTAVTYDKGGLLVSMLRYLLGDTQFLAAMKKYREDHVSTKATLSSFAASVKAATGKDVSAFVNAWATQAGYPTFTVEVLHSGQASQFVTKINASASKAPYLPVQIDLLLADGNTQHEQLAFESGSQSSASFTTASEVLQVRFDPANQIVGRTRGALAGDISLDGEVDGIDLIELGWAMGRKYDPYDSTNDGPFPGWADLLFDGKIDQQDADQLLGSFGKRSGDGG